MIKKRPNVFTLSVIRACGAGSIEKDYKTLAEAIADYNAIWEHTDDSVLSLSFNGLIVAEDDDLLALVNEGIGREDFDKVLDRYAVSGGWGHGGDLCWGHNEGQECCLEYKSTHDFIWRLLTEGDKLLVEYPEVEETESLTANPPDWPESKQKSKYEIMAAEVKAIQAKER